MSIRPERSAESTGDWSRRTWLSCFLQLGVGAAMWGRIVDVCAAGGEESPSGRQSMADWRWRRRLTLEAAQSIMGRMPGRERHCPLDVRLHGETDFGDYVVQDLTYAAEPGDRVPAYLAIPKAALERKRRYPAVLGLHQTHARGRKVVVGLGQSPDDEYGVELARRGYVVLAPAYPLLADYAPDLEALGYESGVMKAIWNNRRGLDLLESLPFVRGSNFATIGHSLGGHTSLFTALFDDRIRAVATSCGFDSFRDYMNGNITGWTSTRYMPRLVAFKDLLGQLPFDFPELLRALAPRPVYVNAPVGDTNFRWRSVDRVVREARPAYALWNASDKLQVRHPDCGHRFPPEQREEAYRVIDSALDWRPRQS